MELLLLKLGNLRGKEIQPNQNRLYCLYEMLYLCCLNDKLYGVHFRTTTND